MVYNKAKSRHSKYRTALKKIQIDSRNTLNKAPWNYVNSMLLMGLKEGNSKQFNQYLKSHGQERQSLAPSKVGSQQTPFKRTVKSQGTGSPIQLFIHRRHCGDCKITRTGT